MWKPKYVVGDSIYSVYLNGSFVADSIHAVVLVADAIHLVAVAVDSSLTANKKPSQQIGYAAAVYTRNSQT
ncbi:hypothetical protein LWI28_013891 [Acer negundo]|uniref:Uncharacterized protein n=1 Tax=Acer negundo TaxID=4023 RepID=A0AAD5NNB8_ACENE|nr:hypothetical protein LWI28_013891 [Acer negundo]